MNTSYLHGLPSALQKMLRKPRNTNRATDCGQVRLRDGPEPASRLRGSREHRQLCGHATFPSFDPPSNSFRAGHC